MNHGFQVGEQILWNGVPYVIAERLDTGMVHLRHQATGMLKHESIRTLQNDYALGKLTFGIEPPSGPFSRKGPGPADKRTAVPIDALPEKRKAATLRAIEYLRRLKQMNALTFTRNDVLKNACVEIAKLRRQRPGLEHEPVPSRTTIWRWVNKKAKAGGSNSGVIYRYDLRGGKNQGRLSDELETITQDAINAIYLTSQKRPLIDVRDDIELTIKSLNRERDVDDQLSVPSISTIRKRVENLDAYEVTRAREGQRAAEIRYRSALRKLKIRHILDRVELDHTPLDLYVVDGETFIPLGRPDITFAIDRASRCILGFSIGYTGHTADVVVECLRHMILPKEYLRARHPEVEGEWLMFGIPFEIWMDNANEFIGNRIASVAAEMNAELQWCPAKQPWWKGGVERFIRTFSHALIHAIPGTTFESIRARGDYDPEKDALITLQDLEMIIHKWIVDVYHNAFHHGLGTTPKLAWNEGALIKEPAMVADVDLMHIAMGDSAEITLQHYGIQIFSNQRFNSPELGMFARTGMLGAKVKVKFHHSDLTKVYVLDEARNQYLVVPNIDPEPIVGLNLEQHLDILKRARDLYANSPDREAYLRAKRDIRVFFDELLRSRRVRNRRRAARMRGDDSGSMRRRAAQSEMDRKMRVGGGGEPQSGPQASDAQDPGKSHSPKPAPSSAPNSEPANDDGWGDMQPIVEQPKPDQNTGASSNV